MIYDLMTSPVTGFYVGLTFGVLGTCLLWILAIGFHLGMKMGDKQELDLIHNTRAGDDLGYGSITTEEALKFVQIEDTELAPGFTWSSTGFVPDEPD